MAYAKLVAAVILCGACVPGCRSAAPQGPASTAATPRRAAPVADSALTRPEAADLDAVLTPADLPSEWHTVVEAVLAAHPEATRVEFDPADLDALPAALREAERLECAALVLPPDRIDVNFAWGFLDAASRVDDDPFVDFVYGVLTGAAPEDAIALVKRAADPPELAARLLDSMGPNMLDNDKVIEHPRLWWGDWMRDALERQGMNNGQLGFADNALEKLEGYGYIHFGGHGYPDRIDQGLTAEQLSRTRLSPCVVWNGACSTGVTWRYFESEWSTGVVREKTVRAEESFCLRMLAQPVLGYFAATHPDHGVPVYQEMERLFTTGCTLGEAMKSTYDAVVIANGGERLPLLQLADGDPIPPWGPTEFMLYGTASRLLYGDPTARPTEAFGEAAVEAELAGDELTLTVRNPGVAFSLMDTFHGDMAAQEGGFNDRLYAAVEIDDPSRSAVRDVTAHDADGEGLQARLVGAAVEKWQGKTLLHIQIDVPSSGYQQGPIRVEGAGALVTLGPAE